MKTILRSMPSYWLSKIRLGSSGRRVGLEHLGGERAEPSFNSRRTPVAGHKGR